MNLLTKYTYAEADIPTQDKVFINLLRKFLNDEPELNRLERVRENTDLELYHALLMTLDQINVEFNPVTSYTEFTSIPSWYILATGATLQVLTSKGILSARNTLTYNDSGGVTVQDYDKYGRYINYFNLLINKFIRSVQQWKESENINGAYGGNDNGLASEYSWEY